MKNNIIKGLIALSLFGICFGISYIIKISNTEKGPIVQVVTPTEEQKEDIHKETIPTQESVETKEHTLNTDSMFRLDVVVSNLERDYESQTYNFKVIINNLPEKAVAKFKLYDKQINDTIAKNTNGIFVKIPSNVSEEYKLFISWRDSLGNNGLIYDRTITGFKAIEKPKVQKIEAKILEELINKCDRKITRRNNQIAQNVKISYTNIKKEELRPQTIDEVYNKIKFKQWTSVNVVDVKYNNDNKITHITLNINHAEDL